MDRDPKISFTRKAKGLGLAFLGALSIGFAGNAGAQSASRERTLCTNSAGCPIPCNNRGGCPVSPEDYWASLSPEDRAQREADQRFNATDPEAVALQRRMDEAERQLQRECAVLRRRVAQGDRSVLRTEAEMASYCNIY